MELFVFIYRLFAFFAKLTYFWKCSFIYKWQLALVAVVYIIDWFIDVLQKIYDYTNQSIKKIKNNKKNKKVALQHN